MRITMIERLAMLLLCCGPVFPAPNCTNVTSCKKIIDEQAKTIESLKKQCPAQKQSPEWKLIATVGITKFVYVSTQGLKDKFFLAQILHQIASGQSPIQVFFYDNKEDTPQGFPMTDSQMRHWKARYNRNPNTGYEEFVFITGKKETKANIRPGYAD